MGEMKETQKRVKMGNGVKSLRKVPRSVTNGTKSRELRISFLRQHKEKEVKGLSKEF